MCPSGNIKSILVVDDAPDTLEMLKRNLMSKSYRVYTAPGVAEAVRILESTRVDLVITDYKMPEISGIDLVRHVRENYKYLGIIMITGYPSIQGAVEAVKTGAEEYLPKPFTKEELFSVVTKAFDNMKARRQRIDESGAGTSSYYGLIGESDAMKKVLRAVDKAASTTATFLITGESGTGKELVARATHYKSARSSAPFIPVNCGGIPGTLLESELFGYVKGAFTGARESRAGFFQTADGGSIFLDEISETSLAMQVSLLRVLQNKEVCMVGSHRPRKVDVRILAATNKNLPSIIEKGLFREDLFYRLNVISIDIPSLRERTEDILLLTNHFAQKYAKEYGKVVPHFSDDVLEVLQHYNWPGNVRELENVIQQLIVMVDSETIAVPDLPAHMRFSAFGGTGLKRTLAEVSAEYIKNVLASVRGNKSEAAKILGIDRKTLRSKLSDSKRSFSSPDTNKRGNSPH
jgi:DNA-binding NtrC family response regulator